MSLQGALLNLRATRSDLKRDCAIPLPSGLTECRNISYGSHGKWNLLDVCYPNGTAEALPTIVSIHGGGYVYGTKEIYRRYALDMARRGFAVVSFNYRLAPKWKFPTPLWDTNAVMVWICKNAVRYHLDPARILLVGDSAGAQLASQYAAIATNPTYAANFRINIPPISIRALGLNCGMYDIRAFAGENPSGIAKDYLGAKPDLSSPQFDVCGAVTANYPPAYLTTACHDFLRENAEPMYRLLCDRGVKAAWKCYGSEEDEAVAHVFHINITHPEAVRCNDDAAAFFRKCL